MCRVVFDRVSADLVVKVLVGKYGIGQWRITIDDFEPDAVARPEQIRERHHLDFIDIDHARFDWLRVGVGVERSQRS